MSHAAAGPWPTRPLLPPPSSLDKDLVLRTWTLADAASLVEAWNDPEILARLDPPARDLASAEHWILGEAKRREEATALDLVVEVGGEVVGEVGLWAFNEPRRAAQIGYWVGAAHRGRRFGTKALELTSSWFMATTGAQALVALCEPDNVASHRTAEGAGFRLAGRAESGQLVYALSAARNALAQRPPPSVGSCR